MPGRNTLMISKQRKHYNEKLKDIVMNVDGKNKGSIKDDNLIKRKSLVQRQLRLKGGEHRQFRRRLANAQDRAIASTLQQHKLTENNKNTNKNKSRNK